jgi:hypothetical protein
MRQSVDPHVGARTRWASEERLRFMTQTGVNGDTAWGHRSRAYGNGYLRCLIDKETVRPRVPWITGSLARSVHAETRYFWVWMTIGNTIWLTLWGTIWLTALTTLVYSMGDKPHSRERYERENPTGTGRPLELSWGSARQGPM